MLKITISQGSINWLHIALFYREAAKFGGKGMGFGLN